MRPEDACPRRKENIGLWKNLQMQSQGCFCRITKRRQKQCFARRINSRIRQEIHISGEIFGVVIALIVTLQQWIKNQARIRWTVVFQMTNPKLSKCRLSWRESRRLLPARKGLVLEEAYEIIRARGVNQTVVQDGATFSEAKFLR